MRDFHGPGRSTVYATGAMVATSHPLAARVGLDMMSRGGNAVDAAIAGAVILGLCEPGSTGIGGDMFALVARPGQPVVGLNGSGRAPMGIDAAALRARGLAAVPDDSADAVVVPGAVAGFEALARDHGRLGLAACLAPSIAYAEAGIPAAPRAAYDWARGADRLRGATRRHYLIDDKPLVPGQIFRHPGQAEVLRRIARDGAAAFYQGEVAEDMVAALRAAGGGHALADFAACRADYVAPIAARYRDVEIVELPPNGQGATALLIAQILAQFDVAAMDPWGPARAHLEVEAARLAYAARNQVIADPDHMTMEVEDLTAPALGASLAGRIDPSRAAAVVTDPIGAAHRDTILITAVDAEGMAVSLIYSTFWGFGSGLASDTFGINFNNRGAGFVLTPGHPNELGGGKRPLHTIIPAMLRIGGEVTMAFGVMGGAYQAHGHARLVSNLVDYGMDVQEAIDGPRLFSDEGVLSVEPGYGAGVAEALSALGHTVVPAEVPIGGAQAIAIDRARGILIGGSDPRKDGIALGY